MDSYTVERSFLTRLTKGEDLLSEISRVVRENNIDTGIIKAIGAVSNARTGFYVQEVEEYTYTQYNQHLEIVSCMGNVSLMNGEPMVHAHIALADKEGKTFGGHLAEGTEIFAAELYIQKLSGKKLKRNYDKDTGLSLW
jgi:hypothetical protein